MLKSGKHNKKLGGVVKVKHWQGMPIYQLTLEERKTCPTYCEQWDNCYGNNMPFAHRFDHTHPDFLDHLSFNIGKLIATHEQGIVVRLHVLGDFYSMDYVEFWRKQLRKHNEFERGLNIYGYTHHDPSTDIGHAIAILNASFGQRCRIRFSDAPESTFSTHVVPSAESVTDLDTVVCPEQLGQTDSCATCGLCWSQPKRNIAFIEH